LLGTQEPLVMALHWQWAGTHAGVVVVVVVVVVGGQMTVHASSC